MNIVDPILLFLLSLFALRGYFKGLFRESFSLAGILGGCIVAIRYDDPMAAFSAKYWEVSPFILKVASFIALFFITYFIFNVIGWLLHRSEKLLFLQTVNRVGGIALGIGKGTAILALIVFFLSSSPWMPKKTRQSLDSSYLAPPLSEFARGMIRVGKAKLFPTEEAEVLNGGRWGGVKWVE